MKSIVPVPKEQKMEDVLKESNKYHPEVGMWRDLGAGGLRVPGFWSTEGRLCRTRETLREVICGLTR